MTEKINLDPIISKIDRLSEKLTDISIVVGTNINTEKDRHEADQKQFHDISNKLEDQSKHLSDYNETLKTHVHRTDLAEKSIKITQRMLYILMIVVGYIAMENIPNNVLKSAFTMILGLFMKM